LKLKISDLTNAVEAIFITAQHQGDAFDVLARGYLSARKKLQAAYAGSQSAQAILNDLPAFIRVAEAIHKHYVRYPRRVKYDH
jgi:hypothetical protein